MPKKLRVTDLPLEMFTLPKPKPAKKTDYAPLIYALLTSSAIAQDQLVASGYDKRTFKARRAALRLQIKKHSVAIRHKGLLDVLRQKSSDYFTQTTTTKGVKVISLSHEGNINLIEILTDYRKACWQIEQAGFNIKKEELLRNAL